MPAARIVKTQFGKDGTDAMWKFVEETTEYWFQRTRNFRENKLKEWARLYKGTPLSEVKNTPWPNAANTIVQLIATHSDDLLSRVMAIYMTDPLWAAKIYGDIDNGQGEDQRAALENFLSSVALDPDELDFYRVEESWSSGTIRNGTGIIAAPWIYHTEKALPEVYGLDRSEAARDINFDTVTTKDGPRPEVVPLNKFLIDTNCQDIDSARFKARIITLKRHELENLKAAKLYDNADIDHIIASPDRDGPDVLQEYMEQKQGLSTGLGLSDYAAEYDLYECWVKYQHNGEDFSIVCTHHPHSKTKLLSFYNYYPKNMEVFTDAKLAYDDDNYYGYGFAEMLKAYQEEVSTSHNQRIDAGTLANSTAFRLNKNSKLHSILTFYPGVLVPADKDEIERLDTSNRAAMDTNGEQLTLSLAKERSGIDPAIGGAGGGLVNQKRGIYSAQGTFAVMQQQNNRTSLRISDMRSAHARAGRKFAAMYSYFGIGPKLRKFGDNAEVLKQAFDNVKSGKLGLAIRPASASLNKEVEKQNDILLAQTMQQFYAADAQIIQALTTPGINAELAEYYTEMLKAKNALMKTIVQNFGHADYNRLIPVPSRIKNNRGLGNGQPPSNGAGTQPTNRAGGEQQGGGAAVPQQAEGGGAIPVGGVQAGGRVPN